MPNQDTNTKFQRLLTDAGFNIVEQFCNNPIPSVWIIGIYDSDCQLLSAQGIGTSKEQALNDAYRQLISLCAFNAYWKDCYMGDELAKKHFVHYPQEQWFKTKPDGSWPDGVLEDEELREFYNPDGELNTSNLIDISSSNRERGLCCLPFESLKTKKKLNVPVNVVTNLYESHGTVASDNKDESRLNALLGTIEQYTKYRVITEGISLPEIPDEVLSRNITNQNIIKDITNAGYDLIVQDASLAGEFPVVGVTLFNSQNQGTTTRFGAHPVLGNAVQKALFNLLRGIDLENLDHLPQASFNMDEIASTGNVDKHFKNVNGSVAWQSLKNTPDYAFFDWDDNNENIDAGLAFSTLCESIHDDGYDIYESQHQSLGMYTYRIIIPTLSEVSPVEDLIWENNNIGLDIRKNVLKQHKTLAECEALIVELEELNQEDEKNVAALIGLSADADSIFVDLTVAELITLLALKIQDNERIQEGCEWLIDYKKINSHRLKVYQCIDTVLQLDGMTDYSKALEKLYTYPVVSDALALIDGEDVFPLFSEWKSHTQLVDAYQKILNTRNVIDQTG